MEQKANVHPRPRLLTVAEVAAELQLSQRFVRKLIASGSLPVIRIGRAVRVSNDVFTAWLLGAAYVQALHEENELVPCYDDKGNLLGGVRRADITPATATAPTEEDQ